MSFETKTHVMSEVTFENEETRREILRRPTANSTSMRNPNRAKGTLLINETMQT